MSTQSPEALSNGARGVNQRLPAVAPDDLANRYPDMCLFILYGCAEIPAAGGAKPRKKTKAKAERRRN